MPQALLQLRSLADKEKRAKAAREAMAVAASKLLAGPEENVAELKVLLGLLNDKDMQVRGNGPLHLA